jgi:carboxypeptidase T
VSACYHVWHHPALEGKPPFAAVKVQVPTFGRKGAETKRFQSLRNDLQELRRQGVAKGIVDGDVVQVGTSDQGRELWALKMGRGSEHRVLFTGGHHAREWISVEVPYLVAKFLIETYRPSPANDKERRVKHLLDNRQIWFVPLVNPDGHAYSVRRNRRWRANRRRVPLDDETIAAPQRDGAPPRMIEVKAGVYVGVDINRNYPTASWGQETRMAGGGLATSRDPSDANRGVWAGPFAGSERETCAIARLIEENQFRASLSYHSYSQLLLCPNAAQGDPFVAEVGNGMTQLINANGNPYLYELAGALYGTTGDLMELCYERVPGRPTFTPEVRPRARAPVSHTFSGLPESQIEPTFRENLGAALALINSAGFDAPATEVRIRWTPQTRVAQVVRGCWRAFEGFTP